MAFIGNTNTTQAFTPAVDFFSGNASTTAFTLSRPVASVAQVQAVVNNVAQNPSDAFTVSSNTITFTSAPSSGTNNIYVYYTSPITQVIAPGQGTVGTTQIQNGVTVNFADGTAAAPSITNDGDTNTGIFFPAADTIAFAEGGAEAMRINSSGNVGIGTNSPQSKVEIRQISSGAVVNALTLSNYLGSGAVGTGVALWLDPNGAGSLERSASIQSAQASSGNFADLRFLVSNSTTPAEAMRIDFTGNLQFNSGYGSVATAYGCRAWVNFNGTGTVAIRASGNVTSITDNGTGDYTVNFTTAMPDANYSAVGSSGSGAGGGDDFNLTMNFNQVPTTSSTRVGSSRANNAVFTDTAYISVAIFR